MFPCSLAQPLCARIANEHARGGSDIGRRGEDAGGDRPQTAGVAVTRLAVHIKVIVAATLLATIPTVGHPRPVAAEPVDDARLLLLLDSSGSMKEPDASGATKIDAAKKALNTVVDRLPAQAQVGLRVYGAERLAPSHPRACTDTELVVPVGRADAAALNRAIAGYLPAGQTPIAYSLRKAAADLGPAGPRTILLVSDGEESCKADPCAVAKQIRGAGIDLTVDVVGLHVNTKARRQLACIAKVGGGTYYDARDADQLTATLNRSSLRAFKDFTVSGTPVAGTPASSSAPEIGPGRYTDTLAQAGQTEGRTKHYLLRRTPGATLRVAVTARPLKRTGTASTSDELKLTLLTPGGEEECTYASEAAFDWNATRDFLNTSIFLGPHANSAHRGSVPEQCHGADRLLLRVERAERSPTAAGPEDPVELVVIEEPPVDGIDTLPEAVDGEGATPKVLSGSAPRGEAVGGGGFHDAVPLMPGTWSGTIQPGERLFYRVRAEWGRAIAATVRFLQNPQVAAAFGQCAGNTGIGLDVYGPDRAPISLPAGSSVHTSTTRCFTDEQVLAAALPEVRYRNRERTTQYVEPVSLAGDYYIAVRHNANEDRRYQDTIHITVAVEGQRAGVPAYRGPDPSATVSAAAPASSAAIGPAGPSTTFDEPGRLAPVAVTTVLAGGGVLTLVALVLLIVYLVRTRRRPGPPPPGR
jgi:Ca-activated chloride channel homolog